MSRTSTARIRVSASRVLAAVARRLGQAGTSESPIPLIAVAASVQSATSAIHHTFYVPMPDAGSVQSSSCTTPVHGDPGHASPSRRWAIQSGQDPAGKAPQSSMESQPARLAGSRSADEQRRSVEPDRHMIDFGRLCYGKGSILRRGRRWVGVSESGEAPMYHSLSNLTRGRVFLPPLNSAIWGTCSGGDRESPLGIASTAARWSVRTLPTAPTAETSCQGRHRATRTVRIAAHRTTCRASSASVAAPRSVRKRCGIRYRVHHQGRPRQYTATSILQRWKCWIILELGV